MRIINEAIYTAKYITKQYTQQQRRNIKMIEGLLNYHRKWCIIKRFQILKEITQSPQET